MRWKLAAVLLIVTCTHLPAHEKWADGSPVPAWIKQACCGVADAHRLEVEDVSIQGNSWIVRGYKGSIPIGTELPSQDGQYWIFYKDFSDGKQSGVYCFFVPPGTV